METPTTRSFRRSEEERRDSNGTGQTSTNVNEQAVPLTPQSTSQPLYKALDDLENALDDVYGVVLDLSSAGRLTKAVHETRNNISKLKKHYDHASDTLTATQNDEYIDPTESDDEDAVDDTASNGSVSDSATCVDEAHGDPLLIVTFNALATSMASLCDALVDMEATSFSSGRYKALLVLHDELWTITQVLKRTDSDIRDPLSQNFIRYAIHSNITRINDVTEALTRFHKIGSSGIRASQNRVSSLHMNAATAAIFLAGVTATTLQFSYQVNDGALAVTVNTLWIGSLALSIGSAMDSYLALTWRQAVFSSPGQRVPWWARFWIMHGYLALLVGSALTFLAGLACFTLQTQNPVAFWTLVAFLCVCCGGVISVAIWFVRDRWKFFQFARQQRDPHEWHWLEDLRKKRAQWRALRTQETPTMHTQSHTLAYLSFKFHNSYWRLRYLVIDLWTICYSVYLIWKTRRQQKNAVNPYDTPVGDMDMREVNQPDREANPRRQWTLQAAAGIAVASMRFLSAARHIERATDTGISPADGPITHMKFSPDGKWLLACGRHTSWIFAVENDGSIKGRQKLPKRRHSSNIIQSSWSKTSDTLVIMRSPRFHDQSKRVMIEMWSLNKRNEVFSEIGVTWSYFPGGDEIESEVLIHLTESDDAVCLSTISTVREVRLDRGNFFKNGPKRSRRKAGEQHSGCPYTLNIALGRLTIDSLLATPIKRVSVIMLKEGGEVVRQVPVAGRAKGVLVNDCGEDTDQQTFLVNYDDRSPELWCWRYDSSSGSRVLTDLQRYVPPTSTVSRKLVNCRWGASSFVGSKNEFVLTPIHDRVFCFATDSGVCIEVFDTGLPKSMPVATWGETASTSQPMLAHVSGTQIRMWTISWEALQKKRCQAESQRDSAVSTEIRPLQPVSEPEPARDALAETPAPNADQAIAEPPRARTWQRLRTRVMT